MSDAADSPPPVNPYAAPSADLHAPHESATVASGRFYAMSPVKAAVMSILTMGLYDLCFWWRHWRTQRQRGLEISVFWRTVFAGFVSFEYRTTLSMALAERGLAEPPLLGAAPSVYLLAMIISRGVSKLLHQPGLEVLLTILFVLARAGALVVFQDAANQALGEGAERGAFNRGASGRTYLAVAGGLLLWALTLLGMLAPEPPEP